MAVFGLLRFGSALAVLDFLLLGSSLSLRLRKTQKMQQKCSKHSDFLYREIL